MQPFLRQLDADRPEPQVQAGVLTPAELDVVRASRAVRPVLAVVAGGGANNFVVVHSATGGDLQVCESIQVNHIPSPSVAAPINAALALNVLSDNATATAMATQTAPITQST